MSLAALSNRLMDKILINIDRQYCSGGKKVALAIGKKLGIEVFGSELIFKAAEESGLNPELFRVMDEKKRFLNIGGMFGSNRFGKFTSNVLSDSELFKFQSKTIRHLADRQSAIFVGRATDYILRDMNCLNVFITAPYELRTATIARKKGISLKEAEVLVQKNDRRRANWYNLYTFRNWGEASNYDLCLDSTVLGIDGTADFIIEFGRRAGKI